MINRIGKDISVHILAKDEGEINTFLASLDTNVIDIRLDADMALIVFENPARKYEKAVFALVREQKINGDVFAQFARQHFKVPSRKHLSNEQWKELRDLLKTGGVQARLKCSTIVVSFGITLVEWESWAEKQSIKSLEEYNRDDWTALYSELKDSRASAGDAWTWNAFVEKSEKTGPMDAAQATEIDGLMGELGWDEKTYRNKIAVEFSYSGPLDSKKAFDVIDWMRKLAAVTDEQMNQLSELLTQAGMKYDDDFITCIEKELGCKYAATKSQADKAIAWLQKKIERQDTPPAQDNAVEEETPF